MRWWTLAVCLLVGSTAQAGGFNEGELRWAGKVATGQRETTRLPIRVRQGGGRGIRVGLRGVSATRVRFEDEAAALTYSSKALGSSSLTVLEVRGRQAVVLRGKRLTNAARARRMLRDAWATLPGGDVPRDLLLVAKSPEEAAALVETPEGPYQTALDDLLDEAQVQLGREDPTIELAELEGTYALQKGASTFAVFRQSGLYPGVVATAEKLKTLEKLVGLLEDLVENPLDLGDALQHLEDNPLSAEALAKAAEKEREANMIEAMGKGRTLRASIGGGRLDLTGEWTAFEGDRVGFSNRRTGRFYDVYDLTVARPDSTVELEARFNGVYLDTTVLGVVMGPNPDAQPARRGPRGLIGGLAGPTPIGSGRYAFLLSGQKLELKALRASTSPRGFQRLTAGNYRERVEGRQ